MALALRAANGKLHGYANSPFPQANGVRFVLHGFDAGQVLVRGSWDDWAEPGIAANQIEPGVWIADVHGLPPGRY